MVINNDGRIILPSHPSFQGILIPGTALDEEGYPNSPGMRHPKYKELMSVPCGETNACPGEKTRLVWGPNIGYVRDEENPLSIINSETKEKVLLQNAPGIPEFVRPEGWETGDHGRAGITAETLARHLTVASPRIAKTVLRKIFEDQQKRNVPEEKRINSSYNEPWDGKLVLVAVGNQPGGGGAVGGGPSDEAKEIEAWLDIPRVKREYIVNLFNNDPEKDITKAITTKMVTKAYNNASEDIKAKVDNVLADKPGAWQDREPATRQKIIDLLIGDWSFSEGPLVMGTPQALADEARAEDAPGAGPGPGPDVDIEPDEEEVVPEPDVEEPPPRPTGPGPDTGEDETVALPVPKGQVPSAGYYRFNNSTTARKKDDPKWVSDPDATWHSNAGEKAPPGFVGHTATKEIKEQQETEIFHFHHPQWVGWKTEHGKEFPATHQAGSRRA